MAFCFLVVSALGWCQGCVFWVLSSYFLVIQQLKMELILQIRRLVGMDSYWGCLSHTQALNSAVQVGRRIAVVKKLEI